MEVEEDLRPEVLDHFLVAFHEYRSIHGRRTHAHGVFRNHLGLAGRPISKFVPVPTQLGLYDGIAQVKRPEE